MSFSRFADGSDVYTFPCVSGVFECCGCILPDPDGIGVSFRTADVDEFLAHLDAHTAAGHAVPDYTRGAVRAWAEEHPDGWSRRASFRRLAPGKYAGIVIDHGRTVETCPHSHHTFALARACAATTLIKETP